MTQCTICNGSGHEYSSSSSSCTAPATCWVCGGTGVAPLPVATTYDINTDHLNQLNTVDLFNRLQALFKRRLLLRALTEGSDALLIVEVPGWHRRFLLEADHNGVLLVVDITGGNPRSSDASRWVEGLLAGHRRNEAGEMEPVEATQ